MRWLCLAFVLGACTYDLVPRPGEERTVCKKDGTCDPGLECWSDRCVRPPLGDCRAVAERLASVRLGNYAPRDAREPAVRELEAQCVTAHVTTKEARCLLEAATDDELAACPRPLLPELAGDAEGCARMTSHALTLLRTESPRDAEMAMLAGIAGRVQTVIVDQCVTRRWAPAAVRCVTDAAHLDALRDCMDTLDADDRRALDHAMEELLASARRGRGGGTGGTGDDPWQ